MNDNKTIFKKTQDISHDWYLLDATDKTLGRVAAKVAAILRGKNKPDYNPNVMSGDYVVIINADKIKVTGTKPQTKLYRHHTGFVGGLKTYTFSKLKEKHPEDPLKIAIEGMLPYGHLGRKVATNVKIYAGSEHPHTGHELKVLEV